MPQESNEQPKEEVIGVKVSPKRDALEGPDRGEKTPEGLEAHLSRRYEAPDAERGGRGGRRG